MGYATTHGYAEAVADGLIRIEGALAAHFGGNFFPPLPVEYVGVAIEALAHVEAAGLYRGIDGNLYIEDPTVWATLIQLPDDLRVIPRRIVEDDDHRYVTVGTAVEILRLDPFVERLATEE